VCRPHLNPFVSFGSDPSTDNATTGKRNSLKAVFFNDGDFKITDVRRRRYRLPIHIKIIRRQPTPRFDLDHSPKKTTRLSVKSRSPAYRRQLATLRELLRQ
jgi:hypothetical protein